MSHAPEIPAPTDAQTTAAKLLASYRSPALKLNHLKDYPLPSRPATLRALALTKDLLFPDHRLRHPVRGEEALASVVGLLEALTTELEQQVYLALAHEHCRQLPCPDLQAEAAHSVAAFVETLPRMRRQLDSDVQAALDGDPAAKSPDEIIFCYPGFEAVTTYRIAHELYKLKVPLLPRMMTEYAHYHTGTDIHPGARIGDAFFIDHATGVVIGETAIIGRGVKLYQGVTLGAISFPKDAQGNLLRGHKRHPTLEDGVVIYAGATVLGDIVIGEGSVIGGSCWITRALPPRTKVVLQDPQMRISGPREGNRVVEPDWVI